MMLKRLCNLVLLIGAMLCGGIGGSLAKPILEVNLASSTDWTFRPARPGAEARTLPVPAGGWRLNGFPEETAGTYERRVVIPDAVPGREQVTLLVFEAVNWEATVFAGPDSEHLQVAGIHLSAWTPFQVDISRFVTPGKTAVLRVAVRDKSFFKDPGGKFTVPAATVGTDRQARGILRGVSLQILPATAIRDVFVKPNTERGTLDIEVTLDNASSKPRKVSLTAALRSAAPGAKWTYPTIAPLQDISLPPGVTRIIPIRNLAWTPGKPSWWWPNVPYRADYRAILHLLNLSLWAGKATGAGTPLQTESVRFGFCSTGQRGNRYTLNGVRINLRGDSLPESLLGADAFARLPGFLPPAKGNGGWPQSVRNYQRLNLNVVRMNQIPCTQYMMQVCDELGMMVIPETAISGVENRTSGDRLVAEAFTQHLRELILRDRNHPSVFKWSLENGLNGAPESFIRRLYTTAQETDPTRPASIDDNADYPTWPNFGIIEHDSQTAGFPDATGGNPHIDRPYGQGEFVWPFDTKAQGPLWFALTTRALREHGNADIRPYTLIDVWPGVISGLTPAALPDLHTSPGVGHSLLNTSSPWSDAALLRIQRSFAPVAAFDPEFDTANTRSDGRGEWGTYWPRLHSGVKATRSLVVFNDEFVGTALQLHIRLTLFPKRDAGKVLSEAVLPVSVPLGGHIPVAFSLSAPFVLDNTLLEMTLIVTKAGKERYRETLPMLVLPAKGAVEAAFVRRDDKTQGNWVGKYGSQGFLVPIKGGRTIFQIPAILLQRGTGEVTFVSSPFDERLEEQDSEVDLERQATVEDMRIPYHGPGVPLREPIAFSNPRGKPLVLRINSSDGAAHLLSLYLLDYKRQNQVVDVDIYDLAGHRLDNRTVEGFGEGAYLTYRFTNTILVAIWPVTPQTITLSGVFVDADRSPL